jgi:hypothetical protein
MARVPLGLLDDLADVLAEVRAWDGVVEKSPGVFYTRRQPFLHFHLTAEGERRADIRGRDGWHSLVLPRPITPGARRHFLGALRTRHAERTGPAARPRTQPRRRA